MLSAVVVIIALKVKHIHLESWRAGLSGSYRYYHKPGSLCTQCFTGVIKIPADDKCVSVFLFSQKCRGFP